MNLSARNSFRIGGFLDIVVINDSHFMGQKMPLLKDSAYVLPLQSSQNVSKIKAKLS